MKKKKGFTLIELLAVIVILGILLSISIVAVNNIRKKQEEENYVNVLSSILTGAKNYIADHPAKLDFSLSLSLCGYDTDINNACKCNRDNKDINNKQVACTNNYGIAIGVKELINKDYIDIDEKKYADLINSSGDNVFDDGRSIYVKKCLKDNNDDLKLYYELYDIRTERYLNISGNINYNECGCVAQSMESGLSQSLKICNSSETDGKKIGGWNSNGKYYYLDTDNSWKANTSKDIKLK